MFHAFRIVAILLIATLPLSADSYGPFVDYRQVDPTGRYYVVIKFDGEKRDNGGFDNRVRFEFAERKPGSPPVTNAEDETDIRTYKPNPEVSVRKGDILHSKGKFEHCPGNFVISSSGLGFAGIDLSGHNYPLWTMQLDALVIVGSDGVIRHRKKIGDLFGPGDLSRFSTTAGGTWWSNGGWFDEKDRALILVSKTSDIHGKPIVPIFHRIDITTGKIERSSPVEITKALKDENIGAYCNVFELTSELKHQEAFAFLPALLNNEKLPMNSRLRVAVALGKLGDKRGAALLEKAALNASSEQDYAISNLPHILGNKAAPVLCEYVRRHASRGTIHAWQAMSLVSNQSALPELVRLLEENASQETVSFACECLSNMGRQAKPAIPSLIHVLEGKLIKAHNINNHEFAALVLGKIGEEAKDALPILIRRAEEYSKEEWNRVKDKRPEFTHVFNDWYRYSESYIIDAIWKIRKK
ncbi:MAG TPA: hypothetical protein PLN21_14605 [Gemmatales bacterium]|nr:hypothetical protein [Gemmatales bacterium]